MSKFQEVIETVPEEDQTRVASLGNYILNTSPGYRPSDAARYAVREYEAGNLPRWEAERKADADRQHREKCWSGPKNCDRCAQYDRSAA